MLQVEHRPVELQVMQLAIEQDWQVELLLASWNESRQAKQTLGEKQVMQLGMEH